MKDHLLNNVVKSRTEVTDAVQRTRSLKLLWSGHSSESSCNGKLMLLQRPPTKIGVSMSNDGIPSYALKNVASNFMKIISYKRYDQNP